jgi:hypothetical protein
MKRHPRLATAVDVLHVLIIAFWVGGFFFPLGSFPLFRFFHAIFIMTGVATQLALNGACPLTIWSRDLRGEPDDGVGFIYRLAASRGIRIPNGSVGVLIAVTICLALITLYRLYPVM